MHLKALTLLVVFTASALADQYSFESYQINFGIVFFTQGICSKKSHL